MVPERVSVPPLLTIFVPPAPVTKLKAPAMVLLPAVFRITPATLALP